MSIFEDHLNQETLKRFEDQEIRKNFKVSNSGKSLIPKHGIWNMREDPYMKRSFRLPKLPSGVYHEEKSLGVIIFGSSEYDYQKYLDVVRSSNLPMMIYNNKRYYVCNREQKRQIRHRVNN